LFKIVQRPISDHTSFSIWVISGLTSVLFVGGGVTASVFFYKYARHRNEQQLIENESRISQRMATLAQDWETTFRNLPCFSMTSSDDEEQEEGELQHPAQPQEQEEEEQQQNQNQNLEEELEHPICQESNANTQVRDSYESVNLEDESPTLEPILPNVCSLDLVDMEEQLQERVVPELRNLATASLKALNEHRFSHS